MITFSSEWRTGFKDRTAFNRMLLRLGRSLPTRPIRSFVIDRRTWARGSESRNERTPGNFLFERTGSGGIKRCCIGFYCLAGGYEPRDISCISMIESIPIRNGRRTRIDRLFGSVMSVSSLVTDAPACAAGEDPEPGFFDDLYDVNDLDGIPDSLRERFIVDRFRRVGVKVTFKGTGRPS